MKEPDLICNLIGTDNEEIFRSLAEIRTDLNAKFK